MHDTSPIVDSFGRTHNSLRVSVTDRCNIRCFYCMPEQASFLPRTELLSFEEIERIVRVVALAGVNKIRLTGGEPLVRSQIWRLIEKTVTIDGIDDVALTTNGILLAAQAHQLKAAGLHRLNISLDALTPAVFERITRRKGLDQVLTGIQAAQQAGFENIRINAVSIKGLTEDEIVPLARFAREHDLTLRFIEFMPLDADRNWTLKKVLTGSAVHEIISENVCELSSVPNINSNQAATDFCYTDGKGSVGFINSVSEPFCENCNRMRITAEGKFRNCLFSTCEWDLRAPLRSGASDDELLQLIRDCITAKKEGHGMDSADFQVPARPMYQIGG